MAPAPVGEHVAALDRQLDWPRQETMLEAAAVACHLVETGVITARGTLAPALAIEPHRPVDDGDQSVRQGYEYHWARVREAFDAVIDLARVDSGTARHLRPCSPASA